MKRTTKYSGAPEESGWFLRRSRVSSVRTSSHQRQGQKKQRLASGSAHHGGESCLYAYRGGLGHGHVEGRPDLLASFGRGPRTTLDLWYGLQGPLVWTPGSTLSDMSLKVSELAEKAGVSADMYGVRPGQLAVRAPEVVLRSAHLRRDRIDSVGNASCSASAIGRRRGRIQQRKTGSGPGGRQRHVRPPSAILRSPPSLAHRDGLRPAPRRNFIVVRSESA